MNKDKFLDNVVLYVETWLHAPEQSQEVCSIVERARWVSAMMLADVAADKHGYSLVKAASYSEVCSEGEAETMDNLVKAIAYFMLEKAAKERDDIRIARWYLKTLSMEHYYIRMAAKRLELPEPEELQYCSVPQKVTLPAEVQKAISNNQASIHIHLEAKGDSDQSLLTIENNNGGNVTIHNTEIKKDEHNTGEPRRGDSECRQQNGNSTRRPKPKKGRDARC